MVSPLGASTPFGEPGAWDDVPIQGGGSDGDFWFDSASDFVSGPGVATEFVMPSFDYGEVWAIKVRLTLSTEPSDNIVVLELMDEDESNYIQKATIPEFGGNEAEINTIIDWETAAYNSGSGSPDLRVNFIGSDSANYFLDVVGVRLRRPVETGSLSATGMTLETFD